MMRIRTRLLSTLAILALAACTRNVAESGNPSTGDASAQASPIVDQELLAFLSLARALHHEANLDESSNDTAHAVTTIERIVSAKKPSHEFPEVEEVLADAYARLAELRLRTGSLDAAATAISEGRQHATRGSYFEGHLYEVAGIIEEARATSLADAGKNDAAAEARARAREHLREAMRIQEHVIERALEERNHRP